MISRRCQLSRRAPPPRALARRVVRRPVLAAATALGILATSGSALATPDRHVRPTQRLAVLIADHRVHSRPDAAARLVSTVAHLRPITAERTTLPVTEVATGSDGIRWLRVMIPGRPNGASGWIAQQGTRTGVTPWHLVVSLRARRVTVYRDGDLVRTFGAVVGKPSTPTPSGSFFVEETLRMSAGEPGGPFALALSARSDALREFEGGPGQIALHGRENLGGTLGAAESHGCVRLGTQSIAWLAERIGPGVPVTIHTA